MLRWQYRCRSFSARSPQRLSNGSVYLLDGEEGHIPQRCKDLLVDHLHVPFNQRFVLWVAHPCRQHYGIVVMRHLHQQGINFRLIFVSLGHGALEVVRHKDLRYASIVFQCVSQTLRKALLLPYVEQRLCMLVFPPPPIVTEGS